MHRIAVRIVQEGFLHPAQRLEREAVDAHGLLHVPVEGLGEDVQLFRCRVEPAAGAAPIECILTDGAPLASRGLVERTLCSRWPGSIVSYLRAQATGRAVVDCEVDAQHAQAVAAAVAVVMYAVAWDESEIIGVELGGIRHDFSVGADEAGHWARAAR